MAQHSTCMRARPGMGSADVVAPPRLAAASGVRPDALVAIEAALNES